MSGFEDSSFEGHDRKTTINLSTSTATSSTALLSSVRAERIAREARRKHESAAVVIQKVWRGRKEARFVREKLLGDLERGTTGNWEKRAGALVYVLKEGWTSGEVEGVRRRRAVLVTWAEEGSRKFTVWHQDRGCRAGLTDD
jgi:ubiquitin-protein ligase E3 C